MATSPPPGVDVEIPNGARIYDYLLGGKDNFAADRAAAQRMIDVNPAAPLTARANRGFLRRAVRFLAEDVGIRQFLDIGAGLPTQENVHQVACRVTPGARVVYADNDPVVVVHGQALLTTSSGVAVFRGDLRRPDEILTHKVTRNLIDFDEPVGLLVVAVLHHLSSADDPAGVMARLRDAMPPGSHLVLSHTADESPEPVMGAAVHGFQRAGSPLYPRTRKEIDTYFDGFDLLDPGLVEVAQWRAEDAPVSEKSTSPWVLVGGVARKLD